MKNDSIFMFYQNLVIQGMENKGAVSCTITMHGMQVKSVTTIEGLDVTEIMTNQICSVESRRAGRNVNMIESLMLDGIYKMSKFKTHDGINN